MINDFFKEHEIEYYEEASLKKYNTYRVAVNCAFLVFPKDEAELILVLKAIKKLNLKYLILGNGSNIIINTDYYDGVVIKLDKLSSIEYKGDTVTAGAGVSLARLAMDTIERSLSGLEFAAGIPGAVGASTAMNAGAYNKDLAMVIKEVKFLNGNLGIETKEPDDLAFDYRDSFFKHHPECIVLSTTFTLTAGDKEEMHCQVTERRKKRQASQPLDMPSAGSVFRNPDNMYAGELIEKCNLKGYNINGAEVSTKHANFIVNTGSATGKDIVALITKIKKEVKKNYNVDLKLEQIIIE